MRRIFLLSVLYLILTQLAGQIPSIPKSFAPPNAWNFTQYGEYKVSNFTGNPSIQLPLHLFENKAFKLPINLDYNVAVVKPDLHPGIVGLGWNLSLGGAITRKVNGLPDEFRFEMKKKLNNTDIRVISFNNGWFFNSNHGYSFDKTFTPVVRNYTSNNSFTRSRFPYILPYIWDQDHVCADVLSHDGSCSVGFDFTDDNTNGTKFEFGWSGGSNWVESGLFDAEPDEFNFSVNGIVGSFRLERNHSEVQKIECNRLVKISLVNYPSYTVSIPNQLTPPPYNGSGPTTGLELFNNLSPWQREKKYPETFRGFKITDESGICYTFGFDQGNLNKPAIEYGISLYDIQSDFWIADSWHLTSVTYPNGEIVNFDYETGPFQVSIFPSFSSINISNSFVSPGSGIQKTGRLVLPIYLSHVVSKMIDVKLTYNQSIQLGYDGGVNGTNIYLSNLGGPNHIFHYCNFGDLKWLQLSRIQISDYQTPLQIFDFYYTQNANQRLKLKELRSYSMDNPSQYSKYEFYYRDSVLMPTYVSNQNDHWGYWNGRVSTYHNSPSSENMENYFAGKNAERNYMLSETLKSIVYPTGGVTNFEFEPHTYSSFVQNQRDQGVIYCLTNMIAGGLRIKEINSIDKVRTERAKRKRFFYIQNFKIQDTINYDQIKSSGVLDYMPKYYWEDSVRYVNLFYPYAHSSSQSKARIFSSQTIFPGTSSSHIGYSEVAELDENGSISIHRYTNHDNGFTDSSYKDLIDNNILSPYTKYTSRNNERGKVYKQIYLDANGNIVKKVDFDYVRVGTDLIESKAKYEVLERNVVYGSSQFEDMDRAVVFGTRYFVNNFSFLPSKITTTNYVGSDSLTIHETFSYNHKNRLLSIKNASNSRNEVFTNEIRYPNDFPANYLFDKFHERHVVDLPIEEASYFKSNSDLERSLIKAKLYEYALSPISSDNFPVLNRVYELANKSGMVGGLEPSVPTTIDFNVDASWGKDVRYQKEWQAMLYSDQKNVELYQGNDGLFHAVGYTNRGSLVSYYGFFQNKFEKNGVGYLGFEKFMTMGEDVNTVINESQDWNFDGCVFSEESFTGKYSLSGSVKSKISFGYIGIRLMAKGNGTNPTVGMLDSFGNLVNTFFATPTGVSHGDWYEFEFIIPYRGLISINSNGGLIDDVYWFVLGNKPLSCNFYNYSNGMLSSISDLNRNRSFYKYDGMRRLSFILDSRGNILKQFCYNYQGQPDNCQLYYNVTVQQTFHKNDCESGFTGSPYTYTVSAGTHAGTSQLEANDKAMQDLANNGQSQANVHGTCLPVYYNVAIAEYFYNANCPNSTLDGVWVVIPAGAYSSTAGQAAADQLARDAAQQYANQNGTCSQSGFPLYGSNNTGASMTLLLRNTQTQTSYYFFLGAYQGWSQLGTIPPGNYDIELISDGYNSFNYSIGCGFWGSAAGYTSLYNVYLDGSCANIEITF
jgi:hypothetical protein